VTSAAVDLESGTLTVTSTGPVGRPEIEAAVTEAGYTLS
jgi:copper chaperone CopZ